MSLFGSLFSGVSGLTAQSQALGMISDNISNVNTVGYKATEARFSTLVTDAATTSSFSPGGVVARPFQLIDEQGLIQASSSPLDIAISGNGFFVVNSEADSTGDVLYTRAGNFHQDNLGNLVNSAGLFLQGWPLDPGGRLPGEPGNTTNTTSSADLSSLETVNVTSINGVAAATTTVALGANLNASEVAFTGPQSTTQSVSATATTDLGTVIGGLAAGDSFTIASGSASGTFVYDPTPSASNEFSNLTELAALVNNVSGLSAVVGGSATDATLTVTGDDSRQDLVITDTVGGGGTDIFGGSSPITVAKTYDPSVSAKNMASGNVSPDFSRAVRIFDAQGTGHDLQLAFLKVADNTWSVEVSANPPTDVSVSSPLVDGQLATGTVTFNGDASLGSLSSSLTSPVTINWTNGASASNITFDWGTAGAIGAGRTDGLSQFDGPYNVAFVNQNGSEVGQLNGVNIDDEGFVIASFSNGETQRLFKVPIATFADASELEAHNGNAYAQTDRSGEFNLREAAQGGAGVVAPSSVEAANVDLGEQFANMIIVQRAFSASSRTITTANQMLDDLIQILR